MLAVVVAVACFAFTTNAKKALGVGPGCATENLFYFQVQSSLNQSCIQIDGQSDFDYSLNGVDDGDNVPEATEVLQAISDDAPYGCPDETTIACTLGYSASQLEKGPDNKWRPKSAEVTNFRCCIRKTE